MQLNVVVLIFRSNEQLEEIARHSFTRIVLSSGPCKPCDSGIMLDVIKYYMDRIPILEICLRYQAIGNFF